VLTSTVQFKSKKLVRIALTQVATDRMLRLKPLWVEMANEVGCGGLHIAKSGFGLVLSGVNLVGAIHALPLLDLRETGGENGGLISAV
jgi:hypothetical protein